MVADKPKVDTAEITLAEYQDISDMRFPQQLEWIQENIDSDAVGLDSLECNFAVDEPPEPKVNYYVVRQ